MNSIRQTFHMLATPPQRVRLEVVALVFLCALAALLILLDIRSPLRLTVGAAFLCFAPGLPIVRLARVTWTPALISLTLATSLSLDGLVAVAILYANLWSPSLILFILICLTLVGSVLYLLRENHDKHLEPNHN